MSISAAFSPPASLAVALKEWASVCRALEQGRQMILLRKGGISETGGEFEIKHRAFLLFPTYLHQMRQMLKAEAHDDFEEYAQEPREVRLSAIAIVSDILQVASRRQVDALDPFHIWTPPLLDMRFSYKPHHPLYLVLVRAYRLPSPEVIENLPEYEGCKSWVPLKQPIDTRGAVAAMEDEAFAETRRQIIARISEFKQDLK